MNNASSRFIKPHLDVLAPKQKFHNIIIGMENQYNSNVFFYKLVSEFIPSSV